MIPYYHIDYNFWKAKNNNNNFDWIIINYFYKLINNNKY